MGTSVATRADPGSDDIETLRYYMALALVCVLLPAVPFWFLIHPFVSFWRRLGPGWTYGLAAIPLLLGVLLAVANRHWLLSVDLGTHTPLWISGLLCLLGATWLRVMLRRDVSDTTLAGLPELDPKGHPQQLITGGLYARMRHPRYAQLSLALLGWALLANYLAGWVTFAVAVPALYGTAVLEERELRRRFGECYEAYCRRVPRFVPRLGRP